MSEPELTAEEIEALRKAAETAMAAFQEWKDKPCPARWRAASEAEEAFRGAVDPSDVLSLLSALAAREALVATLRQANSYITALEAERNILRAELAARERRIAEMEADLGAIERIRSLHHWGAHGA